MNLIQALFLFSQKLLFILIGVLGIGFLIGFHELGHFLFCKLFKVKTPSFSIGFGPALIERKIGDTNFKLSAIPLGGYVEIAGMAEVGQGSQEEAHRTDDHSFIAKPWYQKFLIMLGGILFNLAFAYAVFIALLAIRIPQSPIFAPYNVQPVVSSIEAGSAAERAKFAIGDRITAINNQPIPDAVTLIGFTKAHPQQEVSITVERNGSPLTIAATLDEKLIAGKKAGTLGIQLAPIDQKRYSLGQAIRYGISCTHHWIWATVNGFKQIITPEGRSSVGGPISIIATISNSASRGIDTLFILLALISINLAVINLVPLPIFDGGQILFYTIEAIIRRPLPVRAREYIHMASWFFVLFLIFIISIRDVGRIVRPYCSQLKSFITKK